MPTTTYTPLANITLTNSATSVTFSSIPQTYKDLVINVSGTFTAGGPAYRLNNDSSENYDFVAMSSDGATAQSFTGTTVRIICYGFDGTSLSSLFDYSSTNKHKSILSTRYQKEGATTFTGKYYYRWQNTAAVNQITFINYDGINTLPAGTSIQIYGIIG